MRRKLIVVGVLVTALVTAAVALAATEASYKEKFTTKRRHASTGTVSTYKFKDPSATNDYPAPVKRVVVKYAKGTKTNSSAAPQCNVPAAELNTSKGAPGVCPANTEVGSGTGVAQNAAGAKVTTTLHVYNRKHAMIFDFSIGKTSVAGFIATVRGRKFDSGDLSQGELPGGFRLIKLTTKIKAKSRRVHGKRVRLRTTPRKCPRSRHWTSSVRITFVGTPTVVKTKSKQACRR